MFEVLDTTDGDAIAIHVGVGTRDGYRELYEILAEKTEEHGSVQVYEEAPGWTLGTYLSQLHGFVPDLRYGTTFDIERLATVGDSIWSKLLYYQAKAVRPIWPFSPDEMRYYDLSDRKRALDWAKHGD